MDHELSVRGGAPWMVVPSTSSTNTDLRTLAAERGLPHGSVLLAHRQTGGRGRSGRSWDSADLEALTFSVLLRPDAPRERWGWLPLLAGAAVVQVLRERAGGSAPDVQHLGLKWPNDILDARQGARDVPGWGRARKVGGLLAEVLADGSAVVIGIGLNLNAEQLPVPWAGTLAGAGVGLEGQDGIARAEALARAIHRRLLALVDGVAGVTGTDPREVVTAVCATIGQAVSVQTPGGIVQGHAEALDDDGALLVRTAQGLRAVHAGDVHVRSTDTG